MPARFPVCGYGRQPSAWPWGSLPCDMHTLVQFFPAMCYVVELLANRDGRSDGLSLLGFIIQGPAAPILAPLILSWIACCVQGWGTRCCVVWVPQKVCGKANGLRNWGPANSHVGEPSWHCVLQPQSGLWLASQPSQEKSWARITQVSQFQIPVGNWEKINVCCLKPLSTTEKALRSHPAQKPPAVLGTGH